MQNTGNGLFIDVELPFKKVKEHFIAMFPYLEISLLKSGIEINQSLERLSISQINSKDNIESFQIYENMTVQEVVEMFRAKLGVQIVIFRKLGQNLVETTFTSKWTLKYQNHVGSKIYFDHQIK